MESSIVIKVKYGKTLRRFNACVVEAGKLELGIDELRAKILSLFKLSPEVDLTLTYLDEDGDSVTLADDEDLRDVIRQSLNPLRIKAKVNTEKGNSSSVRSSPRVFHPTSNLDNTVSEILKAGKPIGEVLSKLIKKNREALSKLSLELASDSAASSPQLPELVQQFSKMLQSCIITASESQIGSESAKPSSIKKEPPSVGEPFKFDKNFDPKTTAQGRNTYFAPNPSSIYLNGDRGSDKKEEAKKSSDINLNAKPSWDNIKAVASSVLGSHDKELKKPSEVLSSDYWKRNVAGQCPFAGTPVANEAHVPYNTHFSSRVHPFKRSYSQGGMAGIFHTGVRCDGCGVHPITGPRFKSKVKHDYDLCSICFVEMGIEADYMRLDRPVSNRNNIFCKRYVALNARANPTPTMPQAPTGVVKPNLPKLDSRFVTDVNVIDGTMVAPSTSFTKFWRMRNSGTLAWPQGTQLVWIGGERLSAPVIANLQIPVDGVAVENELEVGVDFVAPELPGRYISYWRMVSPSGQRFGQRIWVLIQVDSSVKDSEAANNLQGLNLNLPPECNDVERAESHISVESCNRSTDLVQPLVVPLPTKSQDLVFPINDNLLISGDSENVVASLTPPPMPLVDESSTQASGDKDDVEQTLLKELEEMGFKQVDLNKEILRVNEYNLELSVDDLCGVSEWDPILEELHEMGFNDNEVNKKLLKINNGSIKGVVMDLITGKKV